MERNLRLLTIADIVEMTRISPRKVRRLVASGFFPRAPIPGRIVYVFESDLLVALRTLDTSTTITI